MEPLKEITINDEVSYENLIEGKVYTVTGTLMDKSTGEPLLVDNKKSRLQRPLLLALARSLKRKLSMLMKSQ